MRDASGTEQRDNDAAHGKERVRAKIVASLPATARILEGFAGGGRLWRHCWSRFEGAAIDWDGEKVRTAARERPTWATYRGDTERALQAGWMGHLAFDVVDLDTYGSPWTYVRAWFIGRRARAERTILVLTDGYMARASLSTLDRTLFPGVDMRRMNVPPRLYLDTAKARIEEWTRFSGEALVSFDTYKTQHAAQKIPMRAHVIVVERDHTKSERARSAPGGSAAQTAGIS